MSRNFTHSPGLPGWGSQGKNGLDGSTGLSMYFTNLNGAEDTTSIKNKILTNTSLWSTSILPNNRAYLTGDTFVDRLGKVYEIRLNTTNKFVSTGTSLSVSEIFTFYNSPNDIGVSRYYNQDNILIDSVFSNTISDYGVYPETIYGIKPVNFGKIEYSDVKDSNYNPFTLFTSGSDNIRSIALVRDDNHNEFRLGNIDADGSVRNVDLTFDVHELKVTKDRTNYFTSTTPDGTVLTNYELKHKNLVDPVFKRDTSSFTWAVGGALTEVSIYWNLEQMTGTNDMASIVADLYIHQDLTINSGTLYSFAANKLDASMMVFKGIGLSGVVGISGLTSGKTYKTYIKVYQNGWERESDRIAIYPGLVALLDISLNTLNATTLNSSTAGGIYNLDISSNVLVNITSTDYSWVHLSRTTNITAQRANWTGTHDVSITIDSYNVVDSFRTATVSVKGSTATRNIDIMQIGPVLPQAHIYLTTTWGGSINLNDGYEGPIILQKETAENSNAYEDYLTVLHNNRSINAGYCDVSVNVYPNIKYRFEASGIKVFINGGFETTRLQSWNDGGTSVTSPAFNVTANTAFNKSVIFSGQE